MEAHERSALTVLHMAKAPTPTERDAEGPAAGRVASGDTAGMTTESMERNKHY